MVWLMIKATAYFFKSVINDILDRYIEYHKISSGYIDYIAATYACKAAVKAGEFLD